MAYAGNKAKYDRFLLPVADQYSAVHDLFMGSAGFTLAASKVMGSPSFISGAESNPLQRQLLKLDRALANEAQSYYSETVSELKSLLPSDWDGKLSDDRGSFQFRDRYPVEWQRIADCWTERVRKPWNAVIMDGIQSNNSRPVLSDGRLYFLRSDFAKNEMFNHGIAAQAACLTMGFQKTVRSSGKGLNIPPSHTNLYSLSSTALPLSKVSVNRVYDSFDQVAIRKASLVLIDPPYWLPERCKRTLARLEKCYHGHDPYGDLTRKLYQVSVARALQGKCKTAVITGYYSDELHLDITNLALHYGYRVNMQQIGAMQTKVNMRKNVSSGKRHAPVLPKPIEVMWMVEERKAIGFQLGLFAS